VHRHTGEMSARQALITVVVAGVLVAAGAVPSMAQVATPTFDDLRAEGHEGEIVYVTDQGGTKVKGRVIEISSTTIALLVKGDSRQWPTTDVSWVTQRHRHAGRGAVIGLAFGALYGAILAIADPAKGGVKGDDVLFVTAEFVGAGVLTQVLSNGAYHRAIIDTPLIGRAREVADVGAEGINGTFAVLAIVALYGPHL
jgi:hypothetical protein